MIKKNIFLAPIFTIFLAIAALPSNAGATLSVASLTHLCGSNDENSLALCKFYIHGVVETWMLKDLVGVDPMRYQSRGSVPEFCETINKVSEDEWVRIVRNSLSTMNAGFASGAVMVSLENKLCK